jgi:glycosyltransferase involved in cell wall biosynthesis/SAM-dependent methyltransferase
MSERSGHNNSNSPKRIIAADIPIDTQNYPIEALLKGFRKLASKRDDVQLMLTGQRCKHEIYSVFNELDRHRLTERAQFHPYYERCEEFPIRKPEADVWVSRNTPGSVIDEHYLERRLENGDVGRPKYALFFTSFHPGKQEGNSTLMRRWLDHLKAAGYIVHVVYYMYDIGAASADIRRASLYEYDLYKEVAVESRLTGANYNGLNLHVDDWCGPEAMDAVSELCSKFEYDIAITNYPWMSAVFDRIQGYTRKILLTHDSFVDRNKRMLEQGYPESGWVSIDQEGERIACERSDIVVAMQEHEADGFRNLIDPSRVQVIGPIFDRVQTDLPEPSSGKLRIGYFGSSNWVNEQNLGEYLKHWDQDEALRNNTEIIIGGGVCETLKDFVPAALLKRVNPRMIGRVPTPGDFFAKCDLIINPERGGTGIKIKTLEAMAHGCGIITTKGGSIGLDSSNPYHNAPDFESLAQLTNDFVGTPDRVNELRSQCAEIYEQYVHTQRARMNDLLGEPTAATKHGPELAPEHAHGDIEPIVELAEDSKRTLRVPEYVQQTAANYHFEEFERFRDRIDVRGKRVLEIGSDYHLASARLFMANGADSVVATNIGDWKSDEPMPDRVDFEVCDASDLDLPEQSFDIIYGIAIIEHVPDFERLCKAIKRFLNPGGVIYFQGCPMWAGSLGHHVWYSPDQDEDFEATFATGGGKKSKPMQYSFTDNNPIPDWAHLAMAPSELRDLLVREKDIPESHADGIVKYVYNQDGTMVGSCSNFRSASEVLGVMGEYFEIDADRIWVDRKPNAYFEKALEHYSEEDLRTLGLRVWMTHQGAELLDKPTATHEPKVSIVIPFYGVEEFIEECIKSVLAQDYLNVEVIFVDDQSPDNARKIVERYMEHDPRITLVSHDVNQGLGPARNTGVKHASGEFLLFLDSDDYFASPMAVTTLVREARASGCPVVVGSCDRIMSDGQRLNFDRDFDESHNGSPGAVVSGKTAFLGASFIPGGQYVPMRAWGTLIDRFTYLDSQLEYPPAEHEDLPHTPFLYHYAGKVLYIPDIVITYRDRSDSISNTGWNSGKIRRQGHIWRCIKSNIERFGLHEHMGNSAVKTAEHLVMKLRQNGIRRGAETAVIETLEEILADAKGLLNHGLLFYTLDSLRGILDFQKYDYNLYRRITSGIPHAYMVEYYRNRIGTPPTPMPQIPISDEPDVDQRESVKIESKITQKIEQHTHHAKEALNENRVQSLLESYRNNAPRSLEAFPSMLTEGDFAIYFDAGRNYQFRGTIVDAGCFVGGTTMSLVQGLLQNPKLKSNQDRINSLIRVYDLFQIDDDYILGHLQKNYPSRDFVGQNSFLGVFEDNLAEHASILDVRPGDVMNAGYNDAEDIEILGVDLCKALPVTDYVVRTFFPRLLDHALVIQQDFIHQYHPHIHLSMLLLDDCFELEHEIRWGGSLSYRLTKQITPDLIEQRFGSTAGDWYNQADRNTSLLRSLVERMFYDENKWVILQVLGVYLSNMGRHSEAHGVYQETRSRFPHYEIPAEVERMIGSEAVHA